jgi:hypothetical protein
MRFAANDWSENQDASLALLDESSEFVPRAEARDVTGIGLLRGDEQDIAQTIAVEAADDFEARGQRFAVTCVQSSHELLRRSFDGFLDCSDFISVLRCGDLVPSLEPVEPKDRADRRTEKVIERRYGRQPV